MADGALGIALIGCGGMGRSLGTQLLQIEAARLVGVSDVDPAATARASAELGAPTFRDARELLAHPGVDAVIIATPPFQHLPMVELAASRGKHLFVEKPLAPTVAECDAILDITAKAGVTLMVGQVLRYYPCWWQALELVRDGAIGTPYGIAISRLGGGWGGWAQGWRASQELSGGLLMEVNAHEIDFMCEMCGEVERVFAEADQFGDCVADYPNLYFVSLRFRNGALGMLHSSMASALNDHSGRIEGSEGAIQYLQGFSPDGLLRVARRDGETGEFRTSEIRIGEIEVEPPVRKELRLFVEAIRTGTPPPVMGADGRRNVRIAEAAYESARSGKPITL